MKSMLRFRKCLLWIWIGLAATVAGFILNPRGVPRKPIAEGLVIANSSLDIGAIWDSTICAWHVPGTYVVAFCLSPCVPPKRIPNPQRFQTQPLKLAKNHLIR